MRKFVIISTLILTSVTFMACEEDDVIQIDENGNPINAPEQPDMPSDETIKLVAEATEQSESEVRQFYEDCIAKGGKGIIGGFGQPACEMQAPDGGQSCTQDSDCSGFCLAETKTCSTKSPPFGCFEVLPEPDQPATICID